MNATNPKLGVWGSATSFFEVPLEGDAAPTANAKQLEIALIWGDTVLDVRHFQSGDVCTAGSGKGNVFQFHFDGVGESFPLAKVEGGKAELRLPEGAKVRARRGNQALDVAGRQVSLELNDRLEIGLDGVALVARWVRPAAAVVADAKKTDFRYTKTLLISLFGTATLVSAIFMTDTTAESLSEDLFKKPPVAVKFDPPKRSETKISIVKKTEEAPSPVASTETYRSNNTTRNTGSSVNTNKRADDAVKVARSGLLALFGGGDGSSGNVFGGGGGTGSQLASSFGSLENNNGASDSGGLGSIGARGTGPGGGMGGLGIGSVGGIGGGRGGGGGGGAPGGINLGAGTKRSFKVDTANSTVQGACERTVIGREVGKHATEVKACYEKELAKDPNLSGKVIVTFTIDATGLVEDAQVSQSTLNNASAESCIANRVRRWKFPEPKGGGVCVINFPWVFKAAGSEE